MAKTYPLDPVLFWETVAGFAEYDYAFGPKDTPSPNAHSAYPKALLALGSAHGCPGFKEKQLQSAEDLQASNYLQRRYTNCCMFVESVLIGTALKQYGNRFGPSWSADHHKAAMNIPNPAGLLGPPRAYVDAGLATPVEIRDVELDPEGIYVVQGKGHNWFIVGYDAGSKRCLRLEANYCGKARPEFGKPGYYGGAALLGLHRVPVARDGWASKLSKPEQRTWPLYREALLAEQGTRPYVSMARVLLTDQHERRHFTLPDENPTTKSSPIAAAYARNESVRFGFFPLGGERSVHTGVHLAKPPARGTADSTAAASSLMPVYSMAPGALAAVRLPRARRGEASAMSVELAASSRDLTGCPNGFVLVRHELEALDDRGDLERTFVLHALYMHLASRGDNPALDDRRAASVPWLNALMRPSHGAVVGVDPGNPANFGVRQSTAADAKTAIVGAKDGKQPINVFGATFADVEAVHLDDKHRPQIAVVGVQLAAEPRLVTARKLLDDHQGEHRVLTFAGTGPRVEQGELLGFVAPSAGASDGPDDFLHWEVLAPVDGGESDLSRFFAYAADCLGLGADFFAVVRETQSDNCLQADEMRALLAVLPSASNAEHGGVGRLLSNAAGDPAYNERQLAAAFHDTRRLAFTTEAVTNAPSIASSSTCGTRGHSECDGRNFWYEATIEISTLSRVDPKDPNKRQPGWQGEVVFELAFEPHRPEYDALPRRWSATLDNGIATLKVPVPAAAHSVSVTPVTAVHLDVVVETADEASQARTQAARLAAVRSLVPARWRNTVVEHCNEWSPAGLRKTLAARFEDVPSSVIDAVAWWNHNEQPIDEQTSLFGAGPNRLPAAVDRIHNANPITVGWMIELLIRSGRLRFAEADADTTPPAAPEFAGWVPVERSPRAQRVGDPDLHAVAIAPTHHAADALVLVAVVGAQRVRLGQGRYVDGVIVLAPSVPLWGRVRLELERPDGSKVTATQTIGADVEVAVPQLAGASSADPKRQVVALAHAPTPVPKRPKRLRLGVPFVRGCPARATGWIVTQVSRDGSTFEAVDEVGVPFAAALAALRIRRGLQRDGAFVVGSTSARALLGPFALEAYAVAQGRVAPHVAFSLGAALTTLRTHATFELLALDEHGVKATLRCAPQRQATLVSAAAALQERGAIVSVHVLDDRRFDVVVDATEELEGEFDAAPALGRVLELNPPEADRPLHVRFGFLLVCGAQPSAPHLALDSDFSIRALTQQPHLLGWCSEVTLLGRAPSVGPLTTRLERHGKAVRLVATAELRGGDARYWRAAGPVIHFAGPGGEVSPAVRHMTVPRPGGAPGRVDASILLAPNIGTVGESIGVTVTITHAAEFAGVEVTAASVKLPAAFQFNATPRLDATPLGPHPDRPGWLRTVVLTHACPPGDVFEVRALDPAGKPLPANWLHQLVDSDALAVNELARARGQANLAQRIEVRLREVAVAARAAKSSLASVRFELVPVAGTVLGVELPPLVLGAIAALVSR